MEPSFGHTVRGRLAVPIICVVLAVTAGTFQRGSAAIPPPKTDPFYRSPVSLVGLANGTVLRARRVDVSIAALPLSGPAADAYQLLYRTQDSANRPVANVTTVIVPKRHSAELVSMQDAEDSLDQNCAPSYQLRVGELAPSGERNGNLVGESALVSLELAAGRVVVIPDPEGPKSGYIVRRGNAHMILDSIRAVERFAPAGLAGRATPVGLVGYSGGGWETAATNELQPAYAPELHIVGVAAGGVPVAGLANIRYLDGSVAAGVLMAVTDAIARDYGIERTLTGALNAAGKAYYKTVQTGCASSVFGAPFAHFDQWTTKPNFFGRRDVQRYITDNQLGHGRPRAPSFYYNAVNDEIIWIEPLDALVAEYCAAGTPMLYVRDPAGAEHIQGFGDFEPMAAAYLGARFAGRSIPTSCGLPYNAVPPIK